MWKVELCGWRLEVICISAPPLRTCDLHTSPCQFRMQVCGECNCRRVGQMLHGGRERMESQVKRWGALHAQINVCSTWDRLWKRSHAGGDGLCLRDLYLWLDKSPLWSYFFSFFFNEEKCSAVCCALAPLLTQRPAISHHHLSSASPWFAQPASWEGVRGLLISHIIISFHSLWHGVRTEDRHGALWWLEVQSHGGGCARACVRSLSVAENILIHFQLAKVHRQSSDYHFVSIVVVCFVGQCCPTWKPKSIQWAAILSCDWLRGHCDCERQHFRYTILKMSLSKQV